MQANVDDAARPGGNGPSSGGDSEGRRSRGGMAPVIFAGVGLLAVLGALAAWLLTGTTGALPGFAEADNRLLVPTAAEARDRIGEIAIRGPGNEATLRRTDTGWALAEANGYPVETARVESMLEALGGLRAAYVSENESPPGEYGFDDGSNLGSTPVRITLHARGGDLLERVTLGNVVTAPGGANLTNLALKRGDDPRIWLAEGELQVSAKPLDWVDQSILHIPRDRVMRVAITAPDGERLVVGRPPEAGGFVVTEGLPPGASVEGPLVLEEMASVLEHLGFEAVRAAADIQSDGGTWTARLTTADGLLLAMTLFSGEDRPWATLEAEATGSGEAAAKKAREFNARHGGWAYRLPVFVTTRLMTRPEDLTDAGSGRPATGPSEDGGAPAPQTSPKPAPQRSPQ